VVRFVKRRRSHHRRSEHRRHRTLFRSGRRIRSRTLDHRQDATQELARPEIANCVEISRKCRHQAPCGAIPFRGPRYKPGCAADRFKILRRPKVSTGSEEPTYCPITHPVDARKPVFCEVRESVAEARISRAPRAGSRPKSGVGIPTLRLKRSL
jgi:hypothetical protein